MVLVTVGENQATNVLTILKKESEIGNDDVDAQHVGVGKHHSGVDDDNIVTVSDGMTIHTKVTQAAEGDDLQLFIGHVLGNRYLYTFKVA